MNKRNIFSLLTLLGVASIAMAGIFGDTSDPDRTRVTGRRKMNLLHGGESHSERHARKYGSDNTSRRTSTKQVSRDSRGRRVTTEESTSKKPGRAARYKKEVSVD